MSQIESGASVEQTGYIKKELPKSLGNIGVMLLIIGLILGVISYLVDPARAAYGYLTSFMFLVCIGIGSLFLVSMEYAAGAVWSVPFRRIAEFFAATVPLFIILVIPLFFGMHDLFSWTNPAVVAKDTVLKARASYLNTNFFIVRDILIFVIWTAFYFIIIGNSRKQDKSKEQKLTSRNIKISAAFIVLFAFTVSILAFDWLMSMEPHWFSTIFGVYYFADAVWGSLALLTLASVILYQKGYLTTKITRDHFYSLGTLMFAFTVFWAYIAFSQYMLQWYGNLPEEIIYYIHRWHGGWKTVSMILVISHFIVPFLILLPRSSKTNFKLLKFASVWILLSLFLDIYWMVMPGMVNNGFQYQFSWLDFTFPIGIIGLVIVVFNFAAKKHNVIPVGDPKLKRGLDFHL